METVKKKKKIWPWIVLGVVITLIIWFVASCSIAAKKMTEATYVTHKVERGNISSTITASGKTEALEEFEIELTQGIETEEVISKVGDSVGVGTVLATLDVESVKFCVAQLSSEISALDMQLAMKDTQDKIYSPIKGRVKQIEAKEGDSVVETVNSKGSLLTISSDSLMRVEIETEKEMTVNTKVLVKWADGEEEGKVAGKTATGYKIVLDDEKAPYEQDAQVLLNGEVIGEGKLEINSPIYVYGTGGIIEDIHVETDEKVRAGDKLFSIEDAPLDNNYVQTLHTRNEKAEELKKAMAYLENPVVVSDVEGIIAQINEEESTVDYSAQGSMYPTESPTASALFVIHTGGAVKMNIEVDEMDIDILSLGQEAEVTLDAYPSEIFKASVTHVSKLGMLAGSITTYSVELTLEYDERILEGMNGSAVITAQTVENVLMLPIDAIHEDAEGIYVYRGENEQSKERVAIETGLSDGNYAEIKNGLNEGDTVIYADTSIYDMMMQFAQEMDANAMRGEK